MSKAYSHVGIFVRPVIVKVSILPNGIQTVEVVLPIQFCEEKTRAEAPFGRDLYSCIRIFADTPDILSCDTEILDLSDGLPSSVNFWTRILPVNDWRAVVVEESSSYFSLNRTDRKMPCYWAYMI